MTDVAALILPVAPDLYALPLDHAREVVGRPAVTPLPTAPPVVRGLINLRGEIVPLLDTAMLLGIGTVSAVEFGVVATSPYGQVALAATDLPQHAVLDEAVGPSELPGTSGLYRLGQHVVALLDPEVLLTPDGLHGRVRTPSGAEEA